MIILATFVQGISPLTVELSHVILSSGNYPFNITYGEVLHIGSHITNTSVALGDSLLSSLDISITGISVRFMGHWFSLHCKASSHAGLRCPCLVAPSLVVTYMHYFVLQVITFSLGESVVNVYDNIVSEEDEILLYVEGYMSNDGSGRSNQVSIF